MKINYSFRKTSLSNLSRLCFTHLVSKVNSFDSETHLFSSPNMAPPAAGETAAVVGGDAQPQQQQRQAGGGFGQTITGIIRIAVFCYFASKFFSPKQKPVDPSKPPPRLMSNLFQKGEPLVIGSLQVDCFLSISLALGLKCLFLTIGYVVLSIGE